MTLTPSQALAAAVIDCAFGVSRKTLALVRARTPRAATVQISARRFADLLDALEVVHPGLLDKLIADADTRPSA